MVAYASGPLSRVGTAILASQCALEFKGIRDLFQDAKKKAKLAGKLLACALALRMPFKTQTVSLVAFSLGTQVVKSCLKTLHQIYGSPSEPPLAQGLPPDIIQSATLLGGASHFAKNRPKYRSIFLYTVNGAVKNTYSRNDRILYLYMASELCLNSIGRNPVSLALDGRGSQVLEPGERDRRAPNQIIEEELVQNFDISRRVVSNRGGLGHSDYMDRVPMMEILMHIDLC